MANSTSGTSRRGGTRGRSPRRFREWARAGVPPAPLPVASVGYLPDGSLAYASWAHRVAFLDPSGRLPARSPIDGGAAKVCGLSVDRGGRWLAVGWTDGHIGLHDAATGAVRRTIRGDGLRLALSPDGQWLATRGPGNSVLLANDRPGQPPLHAGAASRRNLVARLQSGRDDPGQRVTGPHHHALGHGPARGAACPARAQEQSRERRVQSRRGVGRHHERGSTTRIWDARDGQSLAVLPGPWFMRAVAFSPDGDYLAAAADRWQTHGVPLPAQGSSRAAAAGRTLPVC